jgi:PhzF family phenazine biosynthesis protein
MCDSASYFWIDAFAEAAFSGNPAAVCVTEGELPEDTQQQLATEFGISETVFLWPIGSNYGIRWFTPTCEVPLVGHATLAAAHAICADIEPGRRAVTFVSRASGSLAARLEDGELAIELPADQPKPTIRSERLAEGLGANPVDVCIGRHIMAIFDTSDQVRSLKPDFRILSELERPTIIATAPGDDCDYVLRFFAPANGVPEDPVSGVAQCSLVPYWTERFGHSKALTSRQLSRRGGTMRCILDGDRVVISGKCVTLVRGSLDERFFTNGN